MQSWFSGFGCWWWISPCSSPCLNHPELPAAEASTLSASKAQGKSTRGKRKRKKEQEQPKEESQEKGSRKTAGMLSSVLPGRKIKDLEPTHLAWFMLFFRVKEAEVGDLLLGPDLCGGWVSSSTGE